MDPELARAAATAYEHALHGDLRTLPGVLAPLERDVSPLGAAHARRLRAILALAETGTPDASAAAGVAPVAGPPVSTLDDGIVDDADALEALAAFLGFREAPPAASASNRAALWAHVIAGAPGTQQLASESASAAVARRNTPALVEATALGALAALDAGDLAEGTTLARRASRIARTEGLVFHEYLANLVLVRVRRHAGLASQALRIATSLAEVVPLPWRRWLEWERTFTGTAPAPAAASLASRETEALLAAASAGDRPTLRERGEALRSQAGAWVAARAEAAQLVAALDPEVPADPGSWLAGDSASFTGLGAWAASGDDSERASVYVVARPGVPGRRLLAPGLGLLPAGLPRIELAQRRDARVSTTLIELLFAGGAPVPMERLFQRVYGFAYAPAKHERTFRMTLHRTGKEIDGVGRLEEGADGLALKLTRACVAADPRCAPSLAERVLRALGSEGRASAVELAERMQVSPRAVQQALRPLLEDGACEVERDGRNVRYVLEDTTFHEPTLTRMRPRMPAR